MKVKLAEVIITDSGKVLLVQQRKQSAYGLWSFPGGHIEDGETPEQAINREVREELGTSLINARLFKVYHFGSGEEELEFNTFTGQIEDDIKLNEEELMARKWFSLEELEGMQDKLRAPIIPAQARDILKSLSSKNWGEL